MELTKKDGSLVKYALTIEKMGTVIWTYSSGGKEVMQVAPDLRDAVTKLSGTIKRIDPN
jgi:hypothetical protein